MNHTECEALRDMVKLAVKDGNEPIWEKLRNHDTEIALNKQEIGQGTAGQVAQGQRLGIVEKDVTLLKSDKGWVKYLVGLVAAVGLVFLGWYLKTKGAS